MRYTELALKLQALHLEAISDAVSIFCGSFVQFSTIYEVASSLLQMVFFYQTP